MPSHAVCLCRVLACMVSELGVTGLGMPVARGICGVSQEVPSHVVCLPSHVVCLCRVLACMVSELGVIGLGMPVAWGICGVSQEVLA